MKKKISIPERGLRFGLKIAKTTISGVSDRQFFFSWKKSLIAAFFGVKFTEDYYAFTIIPYLFRDRVQKSKKRWKIRFFQLLISK